MTQAEIKSHTLTDWATQMLLFLLHKKIKMSTLFLWEYYYILEEDYFLSSIIYMKYESVLYIIEAYF